MAARVSPEEPGTLPAIPSATRAASKPEEQPAIVRKSIKQREQEMKDELERCTATPLFLFPKPTYLPLIL